MSRSSLRPLFALYALFLGLVNASALNVTVSDDETRCPDGSRGIVNHIQPYIHSPFQPAIFTVDCGFSGNDTVSSQQSSAATLPKAKRDTCTALDCSTTCYGGTSSPLVNDCNAVVTYLQNRGQQQTVNPGQKVVATSNTCLFRFTATANVYGSQTLCDSTWASKSKSLAGQCLPQTPGALCTATGFTLDVCLNPDAPAPVTTSTVPPTHSSTPNILSTYGTAVNPEFTTTQTVSGSTTSASTGTASALGTKSGTTGSHNPSDTTGAYGLALPSLSTDLSPLATVAQASGQESKESHSNIPAIVGGIFGAVIIIIIIVAIWLWRRRARSSRTNTSAFDLAAEEPGRDSPIHSTTNLSSPPTTMMDRSAIPMTMNYGASKFAIMNRPVATISEYSSSSAHHLLSPTQESVSGASTPVTATSLLNQSETGHAESPRPDYEGRPRSISARTLAQALAPNLSERDITRLADTIVARMQAGAPILIQQADGLAGSEVAEDPPPPWRASWNSNNGNGHTETV